MMSPEEWQFLERYKEFIINGLDLLSFALVSSELLHIVQPALLQSAPKVLPNLIGGIAVATLAVSLPLIGLSPLLTILAILVLVVMMQGAIRQLVDRTQIWLTVSRHIFYLGAILFFIARLIAFAVAVHEMP